MFLNGEVEELLMNPKPITLGQAREELARILDKYDWFYDAVIEERCVCVYVHTMNTEEIDLVPDVMYGYQIKLGFSAYLMCGERYGLQKF